MIIMDVKTFGQTLVDFIYRNLWAILSILAFLAVFVNETNMKISALDSRVTKVESAYEKIVERLDIITNSITKLSTNYDNISSDIKEIKETIKSK